MVRKKYEWKEGAELRDHTRKKHQILREYFREYLFTRCRIPQQERFRIAIVDGFSGAGLYKCGHFGSPLIFTDALINAARSINIERHIKGHKPVIIECLLILNDEERDAIEQLKQNISPLLVKAKESEHLHIEIDYYSEEFGAAYPKIKQRLTSAKCRSVFFNLDQCGYSHVTAYIIKDIIASWPSAEILLTFMIKSLLAFLSPGSKSNVVPLEQEIIKKVDVLLKEQGEFISKKEWLAEAELITFNYLKDCAAFVSPFSIHNPDGWQYWLMHFASSYRARQVYNDVLHRCGAQAHFGRPGLNMLSYNPKDDGQLYLFDDDSRKTSKEALYEDIPRFIAESGDALSMHEFYVAAYSETPAHSEDIHEMIMVNEDLEVITEAGGKRRQPNTIKPSDTIKLTTQKSFFFMFPKRTSDD